MGVTSTPGSTSATTAAARAGPDHPGKVMQRGPSIYGARDCVVTFQGRSACLWPSEGLRVLTLPGPPWLYCAPCPVPVSEATPGEQDSPHAGGKAEQKSQHEYCQPFGKCDMRSYLRVPERRPGQRARRGDPHPDAAACSVSRGDPKSSRGAPAHPAPSSVPSSRPSPRAQKGSASAGCLARWPARGARPFRRAAPAWPPSCSSDPPLPPAWARRSGTPRSARQPRPPRPGRCAAAAGCGPSRASWTGGSALSWGCCARFAVSAPDQGPGGATASASWRHRNSSAPLDQYGPDGV